MIIVKLGGSLYSSAYLSQWLEVLASVKNQTVIIVPGGGPFANQVRQAYKKWNINDKTAHEMAILGMQQYALMIVSLNSNIHILDTIDLLTQECLPNHFVWMPYKDVMQKCRLPNNWQVTSDSISLWLANQLTADRLCLIKSANINNLSTEQIISSDIVDKYFAHICEQFDGETAFYHASEFDKFHSDQAYE